MFMTSDLLGHVYNNANSSRSLFPGFSYGDQLLLLSAASCIDIAGFLAHSNR